jgi:hypothetical protein
VKHRPAVATHRQRIEPRRVVADYVQSNDAKADLLALIDYFKLVWNGGRSRRPSFVYGEKGDFTMRVMVIVKANKDSEAGVLPDRKILTEMGTFNEQLSKAGVMLAAEGLQASSKGKRVRFSGDTRTVIDGPFVETKELIAGFWLWQVRSMDEAVEWLKRAPFGGGTEVEIRPVFEAADFGDALTPELAAQEERQRAHAAQNAGK